MIEWNENTLNKCTTEITQTTVDRKSYLIIKNIPSQLANAEPQSVSYLLEQHHTYSIIFN